MEDNNYRTDFENFLKESIEDFKMLPARKIWHSIYNNMHPDRKWPSITVCLLILISILYLGISNNNALSKSNKSALALKEQNDYLVAKNNSKIEDASVQSDWIKNEKLETVSKTNISTLPNNNALAINEELAMSPTTSNGNSNTVKEKFATAPTTTNGNSIAVKDNLATASTTSNGNSIAVKENIGTDLQSSLISSQIGLTNNISNNDEIDNAIAAKKAADPKKKLINLNSSTSATNETVLIEPSAPYISNSTNNELIPTEMTTNQIISNNENKIISATVAGNTAKNDVKLKENSIVTNQKKTVQADENLTNKNNTANKQTVLSKLKQNTTINYYVTPSIGYRTLNKLRDNKGYSIPTSSFAPSISIANVDAQPLDEKALNLEAGASMSYKLSKRFYLKTGLQVNYTNFVSKVNDLGHPIQSSLSRAGTQQNAYRSSQYTTSKGSTDLNKTNFQVAIPIGVDFRIMGNDKVKWFIGTTFQPTYIVSGNAYVISQDGKNYINEKSLLRKINFNTALESYLSIKTSNNIILNVGPQVRYQLLSTFKKDYNYTENRYNVGIKIGVATSF
jgi:hypothetical protein